MALRRLIREDLAPYGAAWSPDVAISPSSIRTYATCPHRIRLQYIERRKAPFAWNLHLTQGTIAHNLLSEVAHRRRANAPLRSEDEMYARALARLPVREFPSPHAHEAAAQEVMRWVRFGMHYVDPAADILAVEKPGKRGVPGPGGVRLTVSTRPDLILLRTMPDGERFVEIVDYKTGSLNEPDDIPPVTMRYAFKSLFQTLTPDTLALRMQFTYVWLKHQEVTPIPLTPEYCEGAWAFVTDLIGQMLCEREWAPAPSPLCNWCPFNGNACRAFETWNPDDPEGW